MVKKVIAAFVAIVLMGIILAIGIGKPIMDRYSYSKEIADLQEVMGVSGDEAAIFLQTEKIEDKALIRNGKCYLKIDTVRSLIDDAFYYDSLYQNGCLLYTTAANTWELLPGETKAMVDGNEQELGYTGAFFAGDVLYLAADYVKQFAGFSYQMFEHRVQIYTDATVQEVRTVNKDTQIRVRGGIKSDVLREMPAGEQVEILEVMENWSKVKTEDALVGYVENKRLEEGGSLQHVVDGPTLELPEYESLSLGRTACVGFHAIGAIGGNATLAEMVTEGTGMNVIAPTWFSLCDNLGSYRSFGEASYVEKAHLAGLQVWGVLDNFNFRNETGSSVSDMEVLSNTIVRRRLEENITREAVELGLDGINLDFEGLSADVGVHYVQFIRELSVLCHQNGLIFSIDDYVPFHFNNFYRLDVQGKVADYVVIMGYDEHYHGSGDPGSVASIDYISSGLDKTLESVPSAKVINALPFYTILWKTAGGFVSDQYITLNNEAAFMEKVGQTATWDETYCQNYAEWNSEGALYQIWLEDADSIRVKLNVMAAKNLGGVAVWRLGYGTETVWNLVSLYTLTAQSGN